MVVLIKNEKVNKNDEKKKERSAKKKVAYQSLTQGHEKEIIK